MKEERNRDNAEHALPIPASSDNFSATLFWFGFFACGGVDAHHDGIMLKPASDVALGQVLFRDTFTQYGLLTVFIQALAIKLGGANVLAIRLCTVLFYAMSSVSLFNIWSQLLKPGWVWGVMAMFWLLPGFYLPGWQFLPWSSVYALFFLLLNTELVLNSLNRERITDWYLVGMTGAAAFWCRQPAGAVLIPVGTFALLLHWRRPEPWTTTWQRFLRLAGGAVLFSILPLSYLTAFDALGDWYIQSLRFAFRFGTDGGTVVGNLPTVGLPLQVLAALFPVRTAYIIFPLLTLFYCVWSIIRIRHQNSAAWLLLSAGLAGIFSWHQYFPVGCARHWYWAAIPMFGFYILALQQLSCWQEKRLLSRVLVVLFATILLPTAATRIKGIWSYCLNFGTRQQLDSAPVSGSFLEPGEYRYWSLVQQAFDMALPESCGREYVNLTDSGLYNLYFQHQKNFHPMYMNWQEKVYDDYPEKLRLFLKTNRPVIVFFSNRPPPSGSRFVSINNKSLQLDWYLMLPP